MAFSSFVSALPGLGDAAGAGLKAMKLGTAACKVTKYAHIVGNAGRLIESTAVIGTVINRNLEYYVYSDEKHKFNGGQFAIDLATVFLQGFAIKNSVSNLKGKKQVSNLTISQRHTGKGNPNAVLMFGTELNNRQSKLLQKLPEFDSKAIVSKNAVNMADLSALTAFTGDEFAMFTKGKYRLIIRGDYKGVNVNTSLAKKLSNQGYKWSGHTHPGSDYFCLTPSSGDKAVLDAFDQNVSSIYNSKGQYNIFERD